MKLKGVKVAYGVQWRHALDTSEHRWITPSERYENMSDAIAALELHRAEYPHLLTRVVKLETTTTTRPIKLEEQTK
jgi:hypothetical protein